MSDTSNISRRDAIKKAAVAAGVVGAVWTAPKVEGLSLRPSYASAFSAPLSIPWTANSVGQGAGLINLSAVLGAALPAGGTISEATVTYRPTNLTIRARVQGSGFGDTCSVNIDAVADGPGGATNRSVNGANRAILSIGADSLGVVDAPRVTVSGRFVCS